VTALLIAVALAVSLAVGATYALFHWRKVIEEMQDHER
jgi:hypothetical protein